MAFNWRKIFHPVATDLFAPHMHMKQLADSAPVIIPVASAAEATEVGRNATPDSPVYVDRLDLDQTADEGAQSRILRTTDGTVWQALSGTTIYSGPATGVTFPAAGGTLGVTNAIEIPAEPWPRIVKVEFQAMPTAIPSGKVEIMLRKVGVGVRGGSTGIAGTAVPGSYTDFLPANAASSYQVVAAATSAAAVTADARFTFLTATVSGA